MSTIEARLAAQESRLTALVELAMGVAEDRIGELDARTRLAALRAPGHVCGDECPSEVARTSLESTIQHQRRKIVALQEQVATARRERDEAMRVVRRCAERIGPPCKGDCRHDSCWVISESRALVAGEAGPSKLDAIMTEREAEIIGESFAAERELRAEIATLRASLAEAQGEVARLRKEAHGWEHEHDSVRSSLTDALARLDAAGRLIERCMGALDGRSMALRADLRAWGKP